MKMRQMRLRWKTRWWISISPRTAPKGKYIVLQADLDVGHDEHNCWDEYLIARIK